jgi:chemotaxis protein MotD
VRSRPAAAAARGNDGRSAFADALDAMERRSGEPERDSRVARPRQTLPAANPGHAIEAANSQTVTGQPVQEPSNAIQTVKTGTDTEGKAKPSPTEEPAAGNKAEANAADPKTPDAPPVPVAVASTPTTPQPVTGKPEGEAVVEASAGTPGAAAAAQAATTPTTDPAAAQAAVAGGAETAEAAAEAKAGAAAPAAASPAAEAQAKPGGATPKSPDQAQQRPIEQANAGAEAKPRPEASDKTGKDEKSSPHRAEAVSHAVAERSEAKADTPPARAADTPAPSPSASTAPPAPAAPSSFGMEVAQKVAAQPANDGAPVPVHALAVTIAARASQGATRFDIRLDPAELGRIDVQLTVDREGHVKSKLVVEKQETLDLLQRDQRNLEKALAQAGVQTREGSLEFSLRDQGGQNARGDQQQPDQRSSRHQVVIEDPDTIAALQASASTYARAAAFRGGVDIRI